MSLAANGRVIRPERAQYDSPGQGQASSASMAVALGKLAPKKHQALKGRNRL
jgi:hypothetical protein